MHKDHRIQALTRGLSQLKNPERNRLRAELESGTIPLLDGRITDEYRHQYWPMLLGLPEEDRNKYMCNVYDDVVGFNKLNNTQVCFSASPEDYITALKQTDVSELLEVIDGLQSNHWRWLI